VEAGEECRRTEPVVRELARRTRLPISIDTTKAAVAPRRSMPEPRSSMTFQAGSAIRRCSAPQAARRFA